MKSLTIALVVCFVTTAARADDTVTEQQRLKDLDAYWSRVAAAVKAGDFEGYKATCHEQGVLVSGVRKVSYPLADALKRWKPNFDNTKAGRLKASVTFRFSQRLGDATTAHETGIFRYVEETEDKRTVEYIHFEGLLVKRKGAWLIVMEYQKSRATAKEWDALAKK